VAWSGSENPVNSGGAEKGVKLCSIQFLVCASKKGLSNLYLFLLFKENMPICKSDYFLIENAPVRIKISSKTGIL
jgi:hypothetical protein